MVNGDLIYTAKRIETRNELTVRRIRNISICLVSIFLLSLCIQLFISYFNFRIGDEKSRMELREDLTGRESIIINLKELNFEDIEDENLIKIRINAEPSDGFLNGILYVKVRNGDVIEFSAPGAKKFIYRVCLN
jgi:hypothetical protein